MKIRPLAITAILMTVVFAGKLPSAKETALQKIHVEKPVMGTTFQITTYSSDPKKAHAAIDAAFAKAEEIEQIASDYRPDSELNKLCRAPHGQPQKISPTFFDLLQKSLVIAEKTAGAYDPTLGPLTQLWRETKKTKRLPDEAILAATKTRCGYQNLVLDRKIMSATLKIADMQLDLGGIAKGYTADAMFDLLSGAGFTQTMIAAGGDIRLGDAPPDRESWNVGLRTTSEKIDEVITLKNCAISTSGDLHQWVEIAGTRYAHIINPKTGLGLTTRAAATVIAPTTTYTDPLATAACLLPDPNNYFDKLKGTSLRLFRPDQHPILTGIFRKDIK